MLIGNREVLAQEGAEWASEMKGAGCLERVKVAQGANHAVLGVGGWGNYGVEERGGTGGVEREWVDFGG